MKFLVPILAAAPFTVFGNEIISQHNEQHAAEEAAAQLLRDRGCVWSKTTRSERFRLIADGDDIVILGNGLRESCQEWRVDEHRIIINWEPPTTRENGFPLSEDDIKEYWVFANGQKISTTSDTSDTLHLPSQTYEFAVMAVDQAGLKSALSESITLTVE